MTIENVSIGDRFNTSRGVFEVIDFRETRSLVSGALTKLVVRADNISTDMQAEFSLQEVKRSRIV